MQTHHVNGHFFPGKPGLASFSLEIIGLVQSFMGQMPFLVPSSKNTH